MHLMDRVVPLDEPLGLALCIGAGMAAAAGLWYSARGCKPEEIPRVGLITVWVFVASSLGIGAPGGVSLHLGLYGLAGFFLRRRLFLATAPALFLQLLLLQHGGWTTLGINILTTSSGAMAGWGLARAAWLPLRPRAFLAGFLGIMAGAALTALVLRLSHYHSSIWYFMAAYSLLAVIEGLITLVALETVLRLRPSALGLAGPPKASVAQTAVKGETP